MVTAKLLRNEFYIIPFILFFIFHRWNETFGLVDIPALFLSFVLLFGFFFSVYFLLRFLFLKKEQIIFILTIVLSLLLYYFLIVKISYPLGINSRVLLFLFVLGAIFLGFKVRISAKLNAYFNVTLYILIVFELISITIKYTNKPSADDSFLQLIQPQVQQTAKLAELPSVYFILLDEYTGSEMLLKHFQYNNSAFTEKLESMNFQVVKNARSNYSFTLLSVSSVLNANYLSHSPNLSVYDNDLYYKWMMCVKNNSVFKSFNQLGYEIINYSPFDIHYAKREYKSGHLPTGISLFFHGTALKEFIELFPFFLQRRLGNKEKLLKMFAQNTSVNANLLNSILEKTVNESDAKPTFAYVHLMMPHSPFVFDSSGNINEGFLTITDDNYERMKDAYLQYLIYTNKVIGNFLAKLKENTKGRAVILLISDHAIRGLSRSNDKLVPYNSLCAGYFPDPVTMKLYDGMSNVNLFRVTFSNILNRRIELLKDSLVLH